MKTREADFGILFRHWIKAHPQFTAAYELKQTSKDSIPFSCVEDHQLVYLEAIRSDKGVLVRVQGTNGEPDYIYLRNEPAYIVIKFPKSFHIITPDAFLIAKRKEDRKSLTESRAKEISIKSVNLGKKSHRG